MPKHQVAKAPPDPETSIGEPLVSEVAVADWSAWEAKSAISLVQRSETLGGNSVVCFVKEIRVVRSEAGDPRLTDEGGYYILRNNELQFEIERNLEPWVTFLRLVDGVRTVEEILRAAKLREIDVWKHLEEAIEYEVLEVRS